MAISDIRKELKAIQEEIQAGHPDEASLHAGRALELLDDSRLLTTTEAKDLLGIGSVNTLKVLVRKAGLVYKLHGNRMMIPLSELEKLQNSPLVRRVHALDRLHASTADLGGMEGLSQEELQELEEFRPGFPRGTSTCLKQQKVLQARIEPPRGYKGIEPSSENNDGISSPHIYACKPTSALP